LHTLPAINPNRAYLIQVNYLDMPVDEIAQKTAATDIIRRR